MRNTIKLLSFITFVFIAVICKGINSRSMEYWKGRIAVVTGASSGIGRAIAVKLAKNGVIVVGLARREDRLKELSKGLNRRKNNNSKNFHAVRCDVSNENDIVNAFKWIHDNVNAFKWIHDNVGPVSILVNNAGVLDRFSLLDSTAEKINNIFHTNVTGAVLCAKEAVKSMFENSINDGYIINVNSVAGNTSRILHEVGSEYSIYTASKHALRSITVGLRSELQKRKTNIRVAGIHPGFVATEIMQGIDTEEVLPGIKALKPEDVAEICISLLKQPPNIAIPELSIMPITELHK